MSCITFFQGDTFVHRLDPRVKVVVCGLYSVLAAINGRALIVGMVLGLGVILLGVARLPWRPVARRFVRLNVFLLFVLVVLSLTMPGAEVWHWGVLSVTSQGLEKGGMIILKANAIVLLITVLAGTIEVVSLGHALAHLKVPEKLILIFLFAVRYIDVLHHERLKLSRAMKIRGFRPGLNRHTFQSLGYLVGMLLVKSLERSERIYAAMKCRGFRGHFYIFRHFAMKQFDYAFIAVMVICFLVLSGWQVL